MIPALDSVSSSPVPSPAPSLTPAPIFLAHPGAPQSSQLCRKPRTRNGQIREDLRGTCGVILGLVGRAQISLAFRAAGLSELTRMEDDKNQGSRNSPRICSFFTPVKRCRPAQILQ